MTNKPNEVQVKVGAKVDPSVQKQLDRIERRMALSRRKQAEEAKKHARQLGGLTKAQQAEATAAARTALTFQQMSKQLHKVTSDLAKYQQQVDKSTRKTGALMRSIGQVARGARGLGNGVMAGLGVGGAVGVAGGINYVAKTQRDFTRLAVSADASDSQIAALKEQIYSISKRDDVAIEPEALMAAVAQVMEKTGDFQLATGNLEAMARTISATGAQGEYVGSMVADVNTKMGLKTSQEILAALDTLVLQGKQGAFTLASLATQGDRVFSAYGKSGGRKGFSAVQEMGALLQLGRTATGSPEQAATALENIITELSQNSGDLGKMGIRVFDDKFAPGTVMRSIPLIMQEIMQKTGGDNRKLTDLFGAESIRLMNALKDQSGQELMARLSTVRGDGSALAADSARVAGDAMGKMTIAMTEAKQEADRAMLKHVQTIAGGVKSVARNLDTIADFVNDQLWFFDEARREKMANKWRGILMPGAVTQPAPQNTDD